LPDTALDLTLERHGDLLKRGTGLVDERDPSMDPRVLFFLEHAIQDASLLPYAPAFTARLVARWSSAMEYLRPCPRLQAGNLWNVWIAPERLRS
jgi:hypothetical protein